MTESTLRPLYIAFEGGEGSGKSTQARLLAERIDAVLVREPGGTALGADVRELVMHTDIAVDPVAEMLLYAADRAQLARDIVQPALAAGRHVVSDRTVWSSYAYQHGGRGIPAETVLAVNDVALGGRWPDLVVYIDVRPDVSATRIASKRWDRMEAAGDDLHARVRATFAQLAQENPDSWLTFDSTYCSVEELAEQIHTAVAARISGAVAARISGAVAAASGGAL